MMRSLVTAIRTLTIFPFPGKDTHRFELALPWFPVVGGVLGAMAGWVLRSSTWLGPELAAALSLSFLAVGTGCLHLDGLADSADGLGCHANRERRLSIMKEPGVGAFAVVAVVLLLIVKWAALRTLAVRGQPYALLIACASGRAMIAVLCVWQPYARASGTGAAVVQGARLWHAGVAVVLVAALGWAAQGETVLVILGAAFLATGVVGLFSRQRIGGITGDVLGATCELVETVALVSFCWLAGATA